ncbi:MAG: hypothetical protein QOG16_672, partial [Actinomycetota bacterium]|nr:hypothetical protein [Actinomycetota bacterium]
QPMGRARGADHLHLGRRGSDGCLQYPWDSGAWGPRRPSDDGERQPFIHSVSGPSACPASCLPAEECQSQLYRQADLLGQAFQLAGLDRVPLTFDIARWRSERKA